MASTLEILLLLSAGLLTVKAGLVEECEGYYTINNKYKPGFQCYLQYCCGNCDDRYCCSDESFKLSENQLKLCTIRNSEALYIVLIILGVVFSLIMHIICCFCPCWFIYKMYKKRRAVAATQVTTVTNTNLIQEQSAVQAAQYPQYQPVPTEPGYGGQPMQMEPYNRQPCAPGPPPSYQVDPGPGYSTSQSANDEGQAMYRLQPPPQPCVANVPSETTSSQPAYNHAYVQPPNTGY